MTPSHPDDDIKKMIKELPMRSDLAEMPLDTNPEIAKAQLLMRQAVPVPIHEKLTARIKALVMSIVS